jgi:hypothetical protein
MPPEPVLAASEGMEAETAVGLEGATARRADANVRRRGVNPCDC